LTGRTCSLAAISHERTPFTLWNEYLIVAEALDRGVGPPLLEKGEPHDIDPLGEVSVESLRLLAHYFLADFLFFGGKFQ
jgi:hypothetical protein